MMILHSFIITYFKVFKTTWAPNYLIYHLTHETRLYSCGNRNYLKLKEIDYNYLLNKTNFWFTVYILCNAYNIIYHIRFIFIIRTSINIRTQSIFVLRVDFHYICSTSMHYSLINYSLFNCCLNLETHILELYIKSLVLN